MKHGTCKLCLKEADLQDSHYLGHALYRLSRADGQNPILLSPNLITQDQKQITDYLLCWDCEQRFSRMGEEYTMRLVDRGDAGFKMMDLVRANPWNRWTAGEYTMYSGASMGIDTDKLAYYALSVIWRGTHVWPTFKNRATGGLELGDHEERIRRYLVGTDPYPPDVIVKVSASCGSDSQDAIDFPRPNPEQTDAAAFTFTTRGIWFDVVVGDPLPAYMYDHCCVRSPAKPIFVGDFDRFVLYQIAESRQTARIGKILQPA
jgi:hypothetical protein